MSERPIWAVSAWGGFVCILFALSFAFHGAVAASLAMLFGAAALGCWAFWLGRREH